MSTYMVTTLFSMMLVNRQIRHVMWAVSLMIAGDSLEDIQLYNCHQIIFIFTLKDWHNGYDINVHPRN